MKHTISFQHTSQMRAESMERARHLVRIEARIQKRFGRAPRIRYLDGNDGVYVYTSTEDMHRDPDGSRAFAVISRAEAA